MSEVRRRAADRPGWLLAGAAAAAGAALAPQVALDAVRFAACSLVEMAPVIGLAVLLAAVVRASGADGLLSRAFAARGGSAIVLSATIGALTPICGVGALPIVAGLLSAGVPLAPVMAFWLASPITDPAMLVLTAGTLGLPFAFGKLAFAGLIGLGGGAATHVVTWLGGMRAPLRQVGGDIACARALQLRFWQHPERRALFRRDAQDAARLILTWLSVAFLLEGVVRRHLPAELVVGLAGEGTPWAIPLAVALGAPIYLDGYAALPLVRGLIDIGMAPGAAMAFLIAGGITSLYASVAVLALVRTPVFLWYLALAVGGSLAAGYGWELLARHLA